MIKPNVIRAGPVPPNVRQVMGRDLNKIDNRNKNQLLFCSSVIFIKSTSTKLDLFTLRVFPILMKMCWKWKINFGECPHWQNVRILLFLVYRNESQKVLNVKYLTVSLDLSGSRR